MTDIVWLKIGDEIVLDGADHRVVEVLVCRADRESFQRVTVTPQLGGEARMLLQREGPMLEATALDPAVLSGERIEIGGRSFTLRWEGQARIERHAEGSAVSFGRGRCAWYVADDGAVATLIVQRYEQYSVLGVPLTPARIDLRFTEGLRRGGRS